jgi:hypothetical protein
MATTIRETIMPQNYTFYCYGTGYSYFIYIEKVLKKSEGRVEL